MIRAPSLNIPWREAFRESPDSTRALSPVEHPFPDSLRGLEPGDARTEVSVGEAKKKPGDQAGLFVFHVEPVRVAAA